MEIKTKDFEKMITYIEGDATQPVGKGMKIIIHCCNNEGKWGAGFVLALSKKWKAPEETYLRLFELNPKEFHKLIGTVQFIPVEEDIIVANIIGQKGIRSYLNPKPLDYGALACGIRTVGEYAWFHSASIHSPRIGCQLAGGSWAEVEKILEREIPTGRPIYVYDFPGSSFNP